MKKKASTKLPTSKATNAYDLLTEIRKLTLAEPKRMRMSYVRTDMMFLPQRERPRCGTAGCIAGWVGVLTKGADVPISMEQAAEILGVPDAYDLFVAFPDERDGTPGHARTVAANITDFQRQYKTELKAKAV